LTLSTRDQQLPGAVDLSDLTVDLVATLTSGSDFILNLSYFPRYQAEDIPQQKAGPAVAAMILDWIWWDDYPDPTGPAVVYGAMQSSLWADRVDRNHNPALLYFDAGGMKNTLQDLKPTPYADYGYNFVIWNHTDQDEIIKQIAQWISYPIGTYGGHMPGHPDHVAAAIPAYGDYTNWMAVRGIHTDQNAYPVPDPLAVYGFWVNDPLPAGIGANIYVTVDELDGFYEPIELVDDPYHLKYVAIVEPPEDVSAVELIRIASPARFSDQDILLVTTAQEIETPRASRSMLGGPDGELVNDNLSEIVELAQEKIIASAMAGIAEQLAPYDADFARLFKQTVPVKPLFIRSQVGSDYYAVPFVLPPQPAEKVRPEAAITGKITETVILPSNFKEASIFGSPVTLATAKFANGGRRRESRTTNHEPLTAVVVLIDAADGHFMQASWVEKPVTYLPVSKKEALHKVFEVLEKYEIDIKNTSCLAVELVHRNRSVYYPEWKITLENLEFFVTQDGRLEFNSN